MCARTEDCADGFVCRASFCQPVDGPFEDEPDAPKRPSGKYSTKLTGLGNGTTVVTIDLDADGLLDLAVADQQEVVLLKGAGDLTFRRVGSVSAGDTLRLTGLVAADFNADGYDDLAFLSRGDPESTLAISYNLGDLRFYRPVLLSTVANATALAVDDVTGDGAPDVVTFSATGATLSVFQGSRSGLTGPPIELTGVSPAGGLVGRGLVTGDVTGDGKSDVLLTSGARFVTLLAGLGEGRFAPGATLETCASPASLAVGRFNGDARLDVAVACYNPGEFEVLLSQGNGRFTRGGVSGLGSANDLDVGDFDGDGRADIISADGVVRLLDVVGNAAVVDNGPETLGRQARRVALGDFNGDGRLDVAALGITATGAPVLRVNAGTGTGAFDAGVDSRYGEVQAPLALASLVATADFTGDGRSDLVFAANGGVLQVLAQGQAPDFADAQLLTTTDAGAAAVGDLQTGDLNGDGAADVVQLAGSEVTAWLGGGDGTLRSSQVLVASSEARRVHLVDLNSDQRPEVVLLLVNPKQLQIYANDGDGGLAAPVLVDTLKRPLSLDRGDFNEDGHLDLVVTHFDPAGGLTLLRGKGDGTFLQAVDVPGEAANRTAGTFATSLVAGDVDEDGHLDVVVNTDNPPRTTLYRGNGRGGFTARNLSEASGLLANWGNTLALRDLNDDRHLDLTVMGVGRWNVMLGDGAGHFRAPDVYDGISNGGGGPPVFLDTNGDGLEDCVAVANGTRILIH
ncbi:MAG: VCBS repeat-containing protein, partial [Archangium sp.]|nr:VCBS repeat-containing protein [Archangium sp.]